MKYFILVLISSISLCSFCGCKEKADLTLTGEASSVTEGEMVSSEQEQADQRKSSIYVYICGAVKNPGVYELEDGSRVYQLVDMAGGMKKKADTQSVNLAETVTDGEMVRIPEISKAGAAPSNEGGSDSAEQNGSVSEEKVNINTASKEQLMTLTGIGETRAEQIIAYRTAQGDFRKIEDIMKVDGIKEGTFAKLKDSIAVQ